MFRKEGKKSLKILPIKKEKKITVNQFERLDQMNIYIYKKKG